MTTYSDTAAGSDKSIEQVLKEALLTDPDSPEGKSLRASVVALHVERARDCVIRSANASAEQAAALKEEARRLLVSAVLADKIRVEVAPAPAAECLLDPPPDAPRDVIAATTLLGAKVRWIAPNDHGKAINGRYDIGISPKPLVPLTLSLSGTEAQVTGLAIGTVYTFTVTASNDDGKGPVSMPANPVKIGAPAPGTPTGVTVAAQGAGQVVSWTAGGGGAPTSHLVRAYDSTKPGTVVVEQRLDGAARSATFATLAKGSYVFGVRPFGDGGFGEEAQSAVVQHAPAPAVVIPNPFERPSLPKPDSLMLFDLGEAASTILDPAKLRLRMKPITEKASQWRYDYLRELAANAARETIGYEQLLAQLMQMTMGKVIATQAAITPALLKIVGDVNKALTSVQNLAKSDVVEGIVKKVGDAASLALALEGLIHFLIDNQPLAFWTGLFDGLIGDICNFDTGLSRTNKFLYAYFGGAGSAIIDAIKKLVAKVAQTVNDVVQPLTDSVAALQASLKTELNTILSQLEETVVSVTTIVPGPNGTQIKQFLGNESGFAVVNDLAKTVVDAVAGLVTQLQNLVNAALGNPTDLVVSIIRDCIVYPILGIMVVSFAGGPIAGWILSGIIAALGIELIRQVARWLAGPLLGVLNDVEAKVTDAVKELQAVLQKVIDLVPSTDAELKLVAASIAGLAHLLPRPFLNDVGKLVAGARNALLSQASELALTAERALGLENATAFDILKPGYDSGLSPAADLPGGIDPTLFGGMALLRDFHLLDAARTQMSNVKETVVTLRMSLFKLLGGSGNPAAFVGETANLFQTFLKGGSLLLNLNEQTLVEQGFPGLYRALVVDVKPIGLLSAASAALPILPSGIPLTITHLGTSRIRVRRDANPKAPPILLPEVLRLTLNDVLYPVAMAEQYGKPGPLLKSFVDALVLAGIPDSFNPAALEMPPPAGQEDPHIVLQRQMQTLTRQLLSARLGAWLDPALSATAVAGIVAQWLRSYPQFGIATLTPTWTTNDDASRQKLRDAIRQECLAQLDNVSRGADTLPPSGGAAALRAALAGPVAEGRARELPGWVPRVAKWGGARYDRERDPQIESLGFVSLVQDFGAESAAFNLLADIAGSATGVLSGAAAAFATANPARAYDAERQVNQYRAFENRGVEGQWLLNLESALNPGTLIDLLLEITVRGCYDDNLAAAVKASRQQSANALGRAQAVASSVNKTLNYPGSLPLWNTGTSPVKTIRYSLRGHRETLLKNALAALDALGGSAFAADGLKLAADFASLDRSKLPLQLLDPLGGIGPNPLGTFALQFQKSTSSSPLGVLHTMLPVSLADLGLGGTDAMSQGTVEGLSFMIVPSGGNNGRPEDVNELLKNVTVHDKLLPLLPQFDPANPAEYQLDPNGKQSVSGAAGTPLPAPAAGKPPKLPPQSYLFMARTPPSAPVTLADVFGSGASLLLDFGDAIDKGRVYDVIFSISVRTPVPQLTASPSAAAI